MSSFGQMTLTTAGKTAYAALVAAGQAATFSKFALGSGSTDTPETLTELVARKMNVGISSIVHNEERVTISARFTSLGVLTGFYAKEMGLYIRDTGGLDVLFAYFTDANPDYIPAENIRVVDVPITVTLVLSDAENVTVEVDLDNIATLADVQNAKLTFDDIYPVGAVYISTVATDPAELFENTTWEALPTGRMLLAAGDGYEAGSTGGSATHKLTISEMPAHNHAVSEGNAGTGSFRTWKCDPQATGVFTETYVGSISNSRDGGGDAGWRVDFNGAAHTHDVGYTGGGKAFETISPYLAVYMWKRIA